MLEILRLISLRHVVHAPLRSLLVLLGIALGVATLVATLAVNRSILGAFHEMVERVAGKADLVITNGEVGVPADVIEAVRAVEGVAHVAGTLEITSRRPSGDGPLLVLGVDFLGDTYFSQIAVESGEDVVEDPVRVVNDPSAILISKTLANRAKTKVGGPLELLTPDGPKSFVVRGILENEGLAASFGGEVALMFTEAAQLAFGRGDLVDRIDVAVSSPAVLSRVEQELRERVAHRGRVERPEGRIRHLNAITDPISRALNIAGAIALLVGMFLIYNAVAVSVAERHREIGVLRALGVTRRRIVLLFCLEALALSLLGGALGIALGHGLAIVALGQTAPTVSRFYAAIRPAAPEIGWELAMLGTLVGVLTTGFAAYWPARTAATVDPIESLHRGVRVIGRGPVPHRLMIAAAIFFLIPAAVAAQFPTTVTSFGSMFTILLSGLLAIPALVILLRRALLGLVERGFGIPGRVALDNVERSLGRTALTVGALMTGVSSSICVATWGISLRTSMYEWLEQSLPADIYVTSGSFVADQHNVLFRPAVIETLRPIAGIEALYPVRIAGIDIGDKRIQLVTVDMRIYYEQLRKKGIGGRPPIEGPKVIDPAALVEAPRVVLGENAAQKLGLHAGDVLTLDTTTGAHRFEVHALVVDYTSDQGTILLDRKWYVEYWKDDLVDTVDVFLEKGADLPKVAAEIRRTLGGGETLFVVTAPEVRDEIRAVIDQALSIFASTDLLTLLIALLGVIGTMFAAVYDRIREIGVLRAVGATQRQIVVAVVIEAGFLGLAAAAGGILVAIPMGYVFVRVVGLVATGWHVDYIFPFANASRVVLLVIATAALAGLYPGRRAARMDLTDALSYE